MGRRADCGTILVVEDDPRTAALVALYLRREAFEVVQVHDGAQALARFHRHRPRLVVLDLMLPNVDGWGICQELRRGSDVPIVILTAREEELDRVMGFTLGADDYVTKPFSPRELVARVKAILRRVQPAPPRRGRPLAGGGLALDPDRHEVRVDGRPVSLTPSEFCLLHTLMRSPGRVFTRGELIAGLYPRGESVVERVVDVHIGKLRQKIERNPTEPGFVHTVRGVGYSFDDRGAG